MKRSGGGGGPEESRRSEEYLAEVNRAYNHYFFHYAQTPLLVVNTADVDLVKNDDDLEDLLRQIRGMSKGTQYYVPKGTKRRGGGAARPAGPAPSPVVACPAPAPPPPPPPPRPPP